MTKQAMRTLVRLGAAKRQTKADSTSGESELEPVFKYEIAGWTA